MIVIEVSQAYLSLASPLSSKAPQLRIIELNLIEIVLDRQVRSGKVKISIQGQLWFQLSYSQLGRRVGQTIRIMQF